MSREILLDLEPISQCSLTELVAQRLIALISSGTLRSGDKLPPERELARQLHVGRTTVREALKLLTLSGVLDARRGDGTYVTAQFTDLLLQQFRWPVFLSADQVDQIVEVREALEVKAVRLAAARATEEDIERMSVYWDAHKIQGRDIELETDLDVAFHHAIAAASHNELLTSLMHSLQHILRQYIALANEMTERSEETAAEHRAVYAAVVAGDPEAAELAMTQHLAMGKRWILRAVEHGDDA